MCVFFFQRHYRPERYVQRIHTHTQCAPFRIRGVVFRFRNDLSKEYIGFYPLLLIRENNKSRKVLERRGWGEAQNELGKSGDFNFE